MPQSLGTALYMARQLFHACSAVSRGISGIYFPRTVSLENEKQHPRKSIWH